MPDTPIPLATSSTYTLVTGDIASNIFCRVTAHNSVGDASADSNTVGPVVAAGGDTTAPTITSSASVSNAENSVLAHSLTANETVTWSFVGGADSARFELSGSTLRWLSNGTKDFEAPNDADTNNIYVVQVRATDTASNTTDQTVSVTVTDVGEGSFATFNGTVTSATLSNGNRTATHVGTGTTDGVQSASMKTTGKFYFELKAEVVVGGADGIGIISATATDYGDITNLGANCMAAYLGSGNIYSNDVTSSKTIGASVVNDIIGVAVDLGARKGWMRKNAGNWNGDASHDPTNSTTGVVLHATVGFAPAIGFDGTNGSQFTANFGQAAFVGTVPSGFTAGWPV